jgi:hypothetical protein
LGHRKKLLEAIAGLVAVPQVASPIPVAATVSNTHDAAERRQVTVMFSLASRFVDRIKSDRPDVVSCVVEHFGIIRSG